MNTRLNPILNTLTRVRKFLIRDEHWTPVRRKQIVMTQFLFKTICKVLGFDVMPLGLTYNQDGLATIHNCDFVRDETFLKAYSAGVATGSWDATSVEWRAFVICWAAQQAMHLEGDFVECGVYRGGFARTLIDFVGFERSKKTFYLLDTFCGLVDRFISPEEKGLGRTAGGYSECYDQVCKTFSQFPNIVIIRGVVPETLHLVKAERIAFLSIDMNCATPEIAAGEFFWDKLVPGAIIVLDDYGYAGYVEQKHAWDKFASSHKTMVLAIPTGQGIIIKT